MNRTYLKQNLWKHGLAVLVFIAYEQGALYLMTQQNPRLIAAMFYATEIPLFYWGTYYIMPHLKRNGRDISIFILLIIVTIPVFIFLQYLIGGFAIWQATGAWSFAITKQGILRTIARTVYLLGLGYAFYEARYGIQQAEKAGKAELELLRARNREIEMENQLLRAKVDPHLLFNSLNFIYSAVEPNSERGARAVELLAQMMRYALDVSEHGGHVLLTDEIAHLDNYLELMKLRSKKPVWVELNLDTDEAEPNLTVPPGVILNLVENMFKHGELYHQAEPGIIIITAKNRHFDVYTQNLYHKGAAHESHGIGLGSIRNRFDKSHPGKYQLKTWAEKRLFFQFFEISL